MAPWYMYVIGLVAAVPVFILLSVAGWALLKALLAWVLGPDPGVVKPTAVSKGRTTGG